MTHCMEHPLYGHLRERFGDEAEWPEATGLIAPYLRIVVEALGPGDAVTFLTAVREALDEEAAREGTIHLGFGAYLWARLEAVSWGCSPAKTSAWEAALTMHRLARLTPEPGGPVLSALVDSALRACGGRRLAAVR
ncbi:hypothetical protein [Streptomyces roseicoloratus]|uniref:Tetracycline repressor TetR C-terminal domain-containing protein n=1 Tax=Streptomyces roseicoloratus TaxID=2508722 RepID=A0ABY9RQL3_9ACTN|nr:hypothetical protein [Streptomyces roseicoloratus]WMX43756.1 hypothetical protein RGF97_01165 [Streptomyces roseicoloratus]